MKRFPIGLPEKMLEELDSYVEPGISRSHLIREAVRSFLLIKQTGVVDAKRLG